MNENPFRGPDSTATSLECAQLCTRAAIHFGYRLDEVIEARLEGKPLDLAKVSKSHDEIQVWLFNARGYASKHCEPELAEAMEELVRLEEEFREMLS